MQSAATVEAADRCKLQAAFSNCKLQLQAASSELQMQAIYDMSFRPSRNVPFCGIWRFYTQTIRLSMRLLEELRIQGGQDLRHSYLTQGCHGISDISCGRVQVACGRLGPPPRVRGMPELRPVVSRRFRRGAYPSKIGRDMPELLTVVSTRLLLGTYP